MLAFIKTSSITYTNARFIGSPDGEGHDDVEAMFVNGQLSQIYHQFSWSISVAKVGKFIYRQTVSNLVILNR